MNGIWWISLLISVSECDEINIWTDFYTILQSAWHYTDLKHIDIGLLYLNLTSWCPKTPNLQIAKWNLSEIIGVKNKCFRQNLGMSVYMYRVLEIDLSFNFLKRTANDGLVLSSMKLQLSQNILRTDLCATPCRRFHRNFCI